MPLTDFNFILVNNIKRPLDTPSVSQESNLFSSEVTHYRDLTFNTIFSAKVSEIMIKSVCISCTTNPITIYKNFS